MENISAYVDVLASDPGLHSVADPIRFTGIVELLADGDQMRPELEATLEAVLAQAHPDARVDRLMQVPGSMWLPLVRSQRCLVSAENIHQGLIEELVDPADWEEALQNVESLAVSESDSDESRMKVAKAVLTLGGLDATRRVGLVAALDLAAAIPAAELPEESIDLIPELIQAGIVSDFAEAFNRIPPERQKVRNRYIPLAPNLHNYIDEVVLTKADVVAIINTGKHATVAAVMEKAELVVSVGEPNVTKALQILRQPSRNDDTPFDPDWLTTCAMGGADPAVLVPVLTELVPKLEVEIVRVVLDALPTPYQRLGREEIDIPESDRPLADALYVRGLVGKPRKRPKQSKIVVPLP